MKRIGPSPCFRQRLKAFGKPLGLRRLKKRKVSLQIGTGSWVEFESYYAYVDKKQQPLESRHVSLLYWGCLEKATPCYYSLAGLTSVVCPSFATAGQLLSFLDIGGCYSRMRKLSVKFGEVGRALGPAALLRPGESLAGKRVAIELDGGRSRMREYNGRFNAKGQPCFDTPWREPKVFIIQVLDSNGKPERKMSLPFYGATMQNGQQCLRQLTATLIALQAHKAKQVQFIADGARFIWACLQSSKNGPL